MLAILHGKQPSETNCNLLFSTFIGGSDEDYGKSIAVDSQNNTYITGYTLSSDFPTTLGCFDNSYNENKDAFVCKLNADGSTLLYSTFVGGESIEEGVDITTDDDNNAYITGDTKSADFPTTKDCFDDLYNDSYDVFVCKFNHNGSSLLYSTFAGCDGYDSGNNLVLDSDNNVYVIGHTRSLDFPTISGSYDVSHNGCWDVFVSKLNMETNIKPIAIIDSVSPNPAVAGETILFNGSSVDDGTVVRYLWFSNLSGKIHKSTEANFSISNLSVGEHFITLQVKDNHGKWSNEVNITLFIKPFISLKWPVNNSKISGTVTISGTASAEDGSIEKVELSIDGGTWIIVAGTSSWNYAWDTISMQNGEHTIKVRALVGERFSNEITITVTVDNTQESDEEEAGEEAREDPGFLPGFELAVLLTAVGVAIFASPKRK